MQFPQIQFYRGSLVRLASGELKQVEDLSSDDFLESARLTANKPHTTHDHNNNNNLTSHTRFTSSASLTNLSSSSNSFDLNVQRQFAGSSSDQFRHSLQQVDENNNPLSGEPEQAQNRNRSPSAELMDTDDDEELDVVSAEDHDILASLRSQPEQQQLLLQQQQQLDYQQQQQQQSQQQQQQQQQPQTIDESEVRTDADEDLYVDSGVVRDLLEVGPPGSAGSPTPSASSQPNANSLLFGTANYRRPSLASTCSSPTSPSPLLSASASIALNPTILIKFFLESSRSIVFIEVPIEHPFFVFHRGWSSWNPQRAYDKFGLKCRKLKIGDTCISLIRKKRTSELQQKQSQYQPNQPQLPQQLYLQTHKQNPQQESDQCNIMLSSIKIDE